MWKFLTALSLCWGHLWAQTPKPIAAVMAGHYTDTTGLFWLAFAPKAKVSVENLSELITKKHAAWFGKIEKLAIKDSFLSKEAKIFHVICHRNPKPATTDFSFVTGSCAFQYFFPFNKARRTRNPIFTIMQAQKPEFMLWLGDNIYYILGEWNSNKQMLKKNLRVRNRRPIKEFMELCPQYALWDDHDYGPNNSDGSFKNKNKTLAMFKKTWLNPYYGFEQGENTGVASHFQRGDCAFFMMDTRWYSDLGANVMLSDAQIAWLEKQLLASTANFKFICLGAQVLTDDKHGVHLGKCPVERQKLIDMLTRNNIKGVVLISGDRHFSEINQWKRDNAYTLQEFTISPLTSFIDERASKNSYRLPNSFITETNFARFDIAGEGDNRTCTVELLSRTGKSYWKHSISLKELK